MTEEGDVVEISYVPDEEEAEKESESHEEKTKPKKTTGKKKSPAVKKFEKKIEELEESLEKATEEKDEYKDKYLRSLAEVDNFRKRMKKEKEEFQRYVLGDFLLGLLEVIDNLERALKAGFSSEKDADTSANLSPNEESIISGVEMIYKQLMELLRKNNVEEIDALGKHFDPNIHQALSKEEREGISEPVVLEVYQKGFMYNGKLLRAALTKVAVPIEQEEPEEAAEETDEEEEIETINEE
jgi:molecular chaperone GrpE